MSKCFRFEPARSVRRSLQSPQAHGAPGGERAGQSPHREGHQGESKMCTGAGKQAALSFRSVGPEDAENPFQQGGKRVKAHSSL